MFKDFIPVNILIGTFDKTQYFTFQNNYLKY